MNIFIGAMLLLSALGLLDKIFGGKRGFAAEFDRGLETMGSLSASLIGIYCIGITLVRQNAQAFANLEKFLPFDPSIIVGSLIAPDLGGYEIAKQIAANAPIGLFAGILVASTLGCTISFLLPVSLSAIKKDDTANMMRGLVLGIVTIPAGLLVGGVLLGLGVRDLIANIGPILVICVALCAALTKLPEKTTKILLAFGNAIRILSFVLFGIVAAGLFVPALQIADFTLVCESLVVVFKITIVVCGAMVLSNLVLTSKAFSRPVRFACRALKINEPAVVGLILSLATSLSMLPLFSRMDTRGKIMNSAFCVSGAFVLGGQLAYISSVEPTSIVAIFMVSKLVGGVCAVAAAALFTKTMPRELP